jgi:hypothetical protein
MEEHAAKIINDDIFLSFFLLLIYDSFPYMRRIVQDGTFPAEDILAAELPKIFVTGTV